MAKKHMKRSSNSLVNSEVQIRTTMRYYLTSVRMYLSKKQKIVRIGDDVEKIKPCALLVGK